MGMRFIVIPAGDEGTASTGRARMDAERLVQLDIRKVKATEGTAEILDDLGIECTAVQKQLGNGLSALELIDDGKIDCVINVPRTYDEYGRPDGYLIRRRAVESGVPLITDLQLARYNSGLISKPVFVLHRAQRQ